MFTLLLQTYFLLFVRRHLFEGLSSSGFDFLFDHTILLRIAYREDIFMTYLVYLDAFRVMHLERL